METMRIPADDRSECESDQRECDRHLCYGFVMQCRYGGRDPQAVGECGSKPEVSLLRRLPAACSGYRHHAYTSRRGSRHGSTLLLLRLLLHLGPLQRAGLGHGLNRLWLAALRGGGFLAVVFVEARTLHVRVEHFEGSAAGVDLVVLPSCVAVLSNNCSTSPGLARARTKSNT